MLNKLKVFIIEVRPRQWVKNLSVFVFLVFNHELFVAHQFIEVFYTFVIFTLLTSSIYIINDLVDYDIDKSNPEKKNRPIAAGKIHRNEALVVSVLLFLTGLIWAFFLAKSLLVIYVLYFIMMLSYTFYLKNLAIIESLIIAGGFVMRVLAGAFVINVTNLYSWVIIVTISAALLLSFGKRRAELTLLGESSTHLRKVLYKYPIQLLDAIISGLFATTFLSYVLLTFETDLTPSAQEILDSRGLTIPGPDTILRSSHLLKLTIPLVFYGLTRYLYIVYKKGKAGTPEKALFSDLPILFTVFFWIVYIVVVLSVKSI